MLKDRASPGAFAELGCPHIVDHISLRHAFNNLHLYLFAYHLRTEVRSLGVARGFCRIGRPPTLRIIDPTTLLLIIGISTFSHLLSGLKSGA